MHSRTRGAVFPRYNVRMARFRSSRILLLVFCVVALLATLPLVTRAQTTTQPDELHAAILSQLVADPRTANIPPAQLQVLVDALAKQAQAKAVSASDILWHPSTFQEAAPAQQSQAEFFGCSSSLDALCPFSTAFGFAGDPNDLAIPAGLFLASGLLLLVIRRMLRPHHLPVFTGAPTPPAA